jgi:KDO2-lipid IV(A) lauroyltransferase
MPELDTHIRSRLARACFREHAYGIFETSWAWYRLPRSFKHQIEFIDVEILQKALNQDRGVLLLGAHYSMLDLITPMIHAQAGRFSVSYRPHDNAFLNHEIVRCRGKFVDLVDVRNTREIVRRLCTGQMVWFAFDQDLGLRNSVFAPFFDQPACTVITPARLCAVTGCLPIFVQVSRANFRYRVQFHELPRAYPGEDQVENATQVNALVESAVRNMPAQYMWMHKRFKTRRDGTRGALYSQPAT